MPYYRLYFMHPETGSVERFADFDAPDDTHALTLAREHIGESSLELWKEGRRVHRIEAFADVPACRNI